MNRRILTILVAVLAAMSIAVATGCGGDDVGSVVSDITQGETGGSSPSADDIASDADSAPDASVPSTETAGLAEPTTGSTSSGAGETSGAAAVEIPADEQALAFQKTAVTAAAGRITLRMPNPSAIPHNIAVDEPEKAMGEIVQKGGVSEITVDFPAGEYEYYCAVPGHREAGMVGKLTVT